MDTLFDALPGVKLPLANMERTLATMWDGLADEGGEAPSDFRASQMNLILHFGLKTSPEEGREKFDLAVSFAQRYPARIIVLCPEDPEVVDKPMEGKLFAQCYLVGVERQMCCLEAMIFGYQTTDAGFLEDAVSIWLENDLPTYHWFNRVPVERITGMHRGFIKKCRRVLFDSGVEGRPLYTIDWPEPRAVRDLAYARTLPYRQSIGQFLSSVEPWVLVDGLEHVEVRHQGERIGEAEALKMWFECCLAESRDRSGRSLEAEFATKSVLEQAGNCLEVEWTYRGGEKRFYWSHCAETSEAFLRADFGAGASDYPLRVQFMKPEMALAEACFF